MSCSLWYGYMKFVIKSLFFFFFVQRWPLRTCWQNRKEPTPPTACGGTPTSASTVARDAATMCLPSCAASRWLFAGAASLPWSPSHMSGRSRHASVSSWSTAAAHRSSSARASSAVWVPSVKRVASSSAISLSRTRSCKEPLIFYEDKFYSRCSTIRPCVCLYSLKNKNHSTLDDNLPVLSIIQVLLNIIQVNHTQKKRIPLCRTMQHSGHYLC